MTNTTTATPKVFAKRIYRAEGMTCECCGKAMKKVALLNTGHEVGADCAEFLHQASWRIDGADSTARFVKNFYPSPRRLGFMRALGFAV